MSTNQAEKWALISVYHKSGIDDFARSLATLGWQIISSGGTAKFLRENGIRVKDVSEIVGGGPILGHRVVTLSREIHAALLAKNTPDDLAELAKIGVPFIDLVCCDFYPLSEAIAKPGATVESVVEMTDIGGPCMVRSAAKGGIIVICDPIDRSKVLAKLQGAGDISPESRQRLRAKAEHVVATYVMDSANFHHRH